MRHLVISYDVSNNANRTRLAKFLRAHMDRVQKSVFEGPVDERRLQRLLSGIAERIDRSADTVRVYELCGRCRGAVEVIGTGTLVEDELDDLLF